MVVSSCFQALVSFGKIRGRSGGEGLLPARGDVYPTGTGSWEACEEPCQGAGGGNSADPAQCGSILSAAVEEKLNISLFRRDRDRELECLQAKLHLVTSSPSSSDLW